MAHEDHQRKRRMHWHARAELARRIQLKIEESQKKAYERARLESIDSAIARVAHEIGNPLNSIMTSVQLLQRELGETNSTVSDMLQRIMAEIFRLRTLLNNYRNISAGENYFFRPISAANLIEDLCALEQPKLSAEGIRLETAVDADSPAVYVDPEKIKQALLNLCKNAEEAMPEGGTLTIRSYESGGKVILAVSDTGIGIPKDFNLFENFKSTKKFGMGLGLVIVRQIVTRHQGSLSYRSEAGKGTTFFVALPIYSSSHAPEDKPET